ncbi:MAG: M1 family metallopeptidase [Phaeodactylibacter sp.]|nr:M1 family metallopeptidase [Phaeodactylibacter sp.]
MNRFLLFLLLIPLTWSCKIKKVAQTDMPQPTTVEETEVWNLDTLEIVADPIVPSDLIIPEVYQLPDYHPSHKRVNDLLHTSLNVRFDWEKEQVIGQATLELTPYFYPTSFVTLDAKNFELKAVRINDAKGNASYQYDGELLTIHLDKTYQKGEKYKVFIDYVATPTETGGSAAITSDQGLFFINPRGEEPDKPQQIWTQGETEFNSRWFPTIDKPNERCTEEIRITVQNRFTTLSNGLLISSTDNGDGTRTDYWKMSQPHAPYLFMLTVGEFEKVTESWNGIPVEYYVEPEFKDHAKAIYPHTVEMLQFFSDKLQLPYPWEKYAQISVRDYVSGAMENTTSVIFGEFMQKTSRELIDGRINEQIVAHEMFHHWFGDYVTCESWANLTLNEGFANYSEYLWFEHKYGKDEADYHRLNELDGYLSAARSSIHPLIHYSYADKEDMFDSHSYNKGGLVLHMLRNYVGDKAFWAALNKYLSDNAYSDVEADELRLAFEEVTGEDLNWFFDQWYFDQGHPTLVVDDTFDESSNQVLLTVDQTQSVESMPPIFQLPMNVDIYYKDGSKERHSIFINEGHESFSFSVPEEPAVVIFDGDNVLLGEKEHQKSVEEYKYQFRFAPGFLDRYEALAALSREEGSDIEALFAEALDDPFWVIRAIGAQYASPVSGKLAGKISEIAKKDPHSQVRAIAMYGLIEGKQKEEALDVARYAVENDSSLEMTIAALEALSMFEAEDAIKYADLLAKDDSGNVLDAVGAIYANSRDLRYLTFFEENWTKVTDFSVVTFFSYYAQLAAEGGLEYMQGAKAKLEKVAMTTEQDEWHRLGATKAINDLHAATVDLIDAGGNPEASEQLKQFDAELIELIGSIKAWEPDEQLQDLYSRFPDPSVQP